MGEGGDASLGAGGGARAARFHRLVTKPQLCQCLVAFCLALLTQRDLNEIHMGDDSRPRPSAVTRLHRRVDRAMLLQQQIRSSGSET